MESPAQPCCSKVGIEVCTHNSDVIMSAMASESPASWLFTQPFIHSHIKEPAEFRVTGLSDGNSLVTDEFPAQRASNAENVSIWWRHHWLKYSSGSSLLRGRISLNCLRHPRVEKFELITLQYGSQKASPSGRNSKSCKCICNSVNML